MKKFSMALLSVFFTFLIFAVPTKAASVESIASYAESSFSTQKDITGDGEADTIRFVLVKESNGYYTDKVNVYINGENALTINPEISFYGIQVNYVKMSKKKVFLQIYGSGDSDMHAMNAIYKYNSSTKKLKRVLNLQNYPMTAYDVVSATSKKIKVKFEGQPQETGRINCEFTFKYTGDKFKLNSTVTTVKSSLIYYDNGDGYLKYFKQNKYKTSKKLKLYKSAGSKKVSVTVPKNKFVTLKKIKMSKGKVYLQFKYGKKTGWRKIFNEKVYDYTVDWDKIGTTGWFYGVYYRLAG